MKNILKIFRNELKKYTIILFSLIIQSYFGYEIIKVIRMSSYYIDFINDNILKIVFICLGFLSSSLLILYLVYIYLKAREDKPLLMILKYMILYVVFQIIISFIIGFLSIRIRTELSINYISNALQYLFRYLFICYVFIKTEKIKLMSIKGKMIIVFLLTLLFLVINMIIKNEILSIFIDVIYYLTIIFVLNTEFSKERRS